MTREHLRLRPEYGNGNRVCVRDRADGQPGLTLAIVETLDHYLVADLSPWDITELADTLTRLADRGQIAECRWCDTLGLIDGDDGPEWCAHLEPDDAAGSA